jgi:uncharacterized protein DUF4126
MVSVEPALPLVLTAGWSAGVNSYATVVLLCVAGRAGLMDAPSAFERNDVLVAALVLYAIEFVADKVPWVDSAWDVIHTIIRPLVGGTVGALLAGDGGASGELQALAGGGSGVIALASHGVKAGLRLAINTSPEPFTNIAASVGEDVAVAGVVLLATAHPWLALAVATVLLAAGITLAVFAAKRIRRGLARLRARRP